MSINLIEKRNSRSTTLNPKTATLRHTLTGTTSETMAKAYVIAATAWKYQTLWRQDIRVEPVGVNVWDVEVTYGALAGKQPEEGDVRWTFDTTGGTMHITNALEHIADYGTNAPNHGGAIGVNSEGDVEGCEVGTSARKWTETWMMNVLSIPFDYGDVLEALTYTTNLATFRGKPAGHVLFLGASGGGSSKDPGFFELTFNFATGQTLSGETICGITGVSKLPHEYLWHEYEKQTDDAEPKKIKKLIAIHRERVYYAGDFSLLGIGTGATPGT
jgi:hypothetical protein